MPDNSPAELLPTHNRAMGRGRVLGAVVLGACGGWRSDGWGQGRLDGVPRMREPKSRGGGVVVVGTRAHPHWDHVAEQLDSPFTSQPGND